MTNTAITDPQVTDVEIRHATIAEAAALSEFAAKVFSDTFAPDNDPVDMHAYMVDAFTVEKQAAEIADARCTCLLAVVDTSIAGYALLRRAATDAELSADRAIELQRFYVDHAWHGQGVAALLMAATLEAARACGAQSIWLGVWERNARAIRFYAKHGFIDVGAQEFRLGSDLQTDRVMERSLTESH